MTPAVFYREAFRRNCPGARLSRDEWKELERLIEVAQEEAFKAGKGERK